MHNRWRQLLALVLILIAVAAALWTWTRTTTSRYDPPERGGRFWAHRTQNADPKTRSHALKKLADIQAPQGAELAEHALKTDPSGYVRAVAAETLGRYAAPEHVPALEAALDDKHSPVSDEAVRALGRIGTDAAFAALQSKVGDDRPHRTVMIVATALPRFQNRACETLLVELLQTTRSAWIRWRTIRALGQVGTKTCVPALEKLRGAPFQGTDGETARAGEREAPGVRPQDILGVVNRMIEDAIAAAAARPPWPE